MVEIYNVFKGSNQDGEAQLSSNDQELSDSNVNVQVPDQLAGTDDFSKLEALDAYWVKEVSRYLKEDLKVDFNKVDLYLSLREQCEKLKTESYESFHQEMANQNGGDYKYRVSQDQTKAEEKINQQCLDQLKNLIGEKAFIKFIEFKDQFNRQSKLKHPQLGPVIEI